MSHMTKIKEGMRPDSGKVKNPSSGGVKPGGTQPAALASVNLRDHDGCYAKGTTKKHSY